MKKMKPLLLIILMLMTNNVHARFFQFVQTSWAGHEGEIPDTSVEYDIYPDRPDVQSFINTTRMDLYKDGEFRQSLFGWSLLGIPAAYEYWSFEGAGEYHITLTVEIELNPDSPPWCNLSSDCYIPSDESYTETFVSALDITIIEDINAAEPEPKPEAVPEAEPEPKPENEPKPETPKVIEPDPVTPVERETPKEETPVVDPEEPTEPVIPSADPVAPVAEPKAPVDEPVKPVIETTESPQQPEVTPESIEEPEKDESLVEPVSILANDTDAKNDNEGSVSSGSLSLWFIGLFLMIRRYV